MPFPTQGAMPPNLVVIQNSWCHEEYRDTRRCLHHKVVYNVILALDPFAPIDEVRQGLPKSLHKAATNAFPNTRAMPPNLVSYKIVGMMRNIMIQGDACITN